MPICHEWNTIGNQAALFFPLLTLEGLTAHPIGTTASPLGYYDYLPPGYGPGAKDPLLIFLHGAGGNGDGSPALLPDVINDAGIASYIANNGWAADRPFVVLSPQHNSIDSPAYPYPCSGLFFASCVMQQQHDYGNPLPAGSRCWAPAEVRAFLDYALAHYNVDPTRVYLTGLSCGGYGVWESLAQFGAGRIAAAVPIAGDGRPALGSSGCTLASVPIWAFAGDADEIVNPAGSGDTIGALRACPAPPAKDLRLTIYQGVDHDSWDHAYSGSQGQDIYRLLTSVSNFSAYGDDSTALTFYNTHLQPIPALTAGEKITLRRQDRPHRHGLRYQPMREAFGGKLPIHAE